MPRFRGRADTYGRRPGTRSAETMTAARMGPLLSSELHLHGGGQGFLRSWRIECLRRTGTSAPVPFSSRRRTRSSRRRLRPLQTEEYASVPEERECFHQGPLRRAGNNPDRHPIRPPERPAFAFLRRSAKLHVFGLKFREFLAWRKLPQKWSLTFALRPAWA